MNVMSTTVINCSKNVDVYGRGLPGLTEPQTGFISNIPSKSAEFNSFFSEKKLEQVPRTTDRTDRTDLWSSRMVYSDD